MSLFLRPLHAWDDITTDLLTMNTATRLYIEVFIRLSVEWSRILTFHQMGTIGQDSARDAIYRNNLHFIRHQLLQGEHRQLLKDPEAFARDGLAEQAPHLMTDHAVTTYRQTLDAASLVFTHSILDATMLDCLRICALLAPSEWLVALKDKKVGIAETASRPFAELLREAIDTELTQRWLRLVGQRRPILKWRLADG